MEDYQIRVIQEQKELDEKINKLEAFIRTDTYDKLDDDEKFRLIDQWEVMNDYSTILGKRIECFDD